jgi:hypothetical protein
MSGTKLAATDVDASAGVPVSEDVLEYAEGNLHAGTNWWGAFVIGLSPARSSSPGRRRHF